MDQRVLELTVVSAKDVRDGRWRCSGKMKAYAVVRIEPFAVRATETDEKNGSNPNWNSTFTFTLPSFFLGLANRMVVVDIFRKGCISDAKVGSAIFPVADIQKAGIDRRQFLTYRLILSHHHHPSRRHQPTLTISSCLRHPDTAGIEVAGPRPQHVAPPRLQSRSSGIAFGTVAGC